MNIAPKPNKPRMRQTHSVDGRPLWTCRLTVHGVTYEAAGSTQKHAFARMHHVRTMHDALKAHDHERARALSYGQATP